MRPLTYTAQLPDANSIARWYTKPDEGGSRRMDYMCPVRMDYMCPVRMHEILFHCIQCEDMTEYQKKRTAKALADIEGKMQADFFNQTPDTDESERQEHQITVGPCEEAHRPIPA